MPKQLVHERLAKAHHFAVGFSLGVEVRSTFAATHRQTGKRILECLLEAEELEHAQIDARMKSHAAFVGADSAVELHAPRAIHLHVAAIVLPHDTEGDHPIGFGHPLEDLRVAVPPVVEYERHHRLGDFADRLMELRLIRIAPNDLLHEPLDFRVQVVFAGERRRCRRPSD